MITKQTSVLSRRGESTVRRYIEGGVVLGEGEGYLRAYEDYLTNTLGYDLTDEGVQVWREVEGYPDYEVSTLGLVRIADTREVLALNAKQKYEEGSKASWRVKVILVNEEGRKVQKVHQLVIDTFLGKCPTYAKDSKGEYIVSHENDRPLDNRLINLKYRTKQENKDLEGLNRDLVKGYLTVQNRDYVFELLLEIMQENGLDIHSGLADELEDYEIDAVREHTGFSKGTIKSMYEMKVHAMGHLARLTVDKYGNFYRATDVKRETKKQEVLV